MKPGLTDRVQKNNEKLKDEVDKMKIISVKENPEFMNQAIQYFQSKWASEETMMLYEDSISQG